MSKFQNLGSIENSDRHELRAEYLEKELSLLRESTFNSLRDLKTSHENEINRLKDKHGDDLKRLAQNYEKILKDQLERVEKISKQRAEEKIRHSQMNWERKLKEKIQNIRRDEESIRQNVIEKSLNSAQQTWKEEAQRKLKNAANAWAVAEEERFRKFQVDLVHSKSMELAEREAYWRGELARVTGSSGSSSQEGRWQNNRNNTGQNQSSKNRQHGKFVILIFVLTFITGGVLYLLAPQWQTPVEAVIEHIVSEQDTGVRDTIYTYMPSLRPNSGNIKSVVQEAAVVKSIANLRENPGLRAHIIRVLAVGTAVRVQEIRADWSHIIVDDATKDAGWIHTSLLNTTK